MARINFTGFDTGDTIESPDNSNASFSNSTTLGGVGYSLVLSPLTSGTAYYSLAGVGTNGDHSSSTNYSTSYTRFYAYLSDLPSSGKNEQFFSIRSASLAVVVEVRLNDLGRLSLYDSTGSSLASGSTSLDLSTWYRIELFWNNSTGDGTLKLNGSTEINVSGTSVGSHQPNIWTLGKRDNVDSGAYTVNFDHFAIDTAGYPGEGRVTLFKPSDSGAFGDWTPLSGADWSNLDEVPHDSDSTYITSSTTNDITTLVMENSAGTVINQSAIKSAKAINILRATSGVPTVKSRLRSSNVNSDNSVGLVLSPTYQGQFVLANIDPKTSGTWKSDGIDNTQIGIIMGSTGGIVRVTSSLLSVEADQNSITSSGGLLGGGLAKLNRFYASPTILGGGLAGSTATVRHFFANTNGSGGVVGASTATVRHSFANVNASGGAVGAGTPTVRHIFVNTNASGGAVLAGVNIHTSFFFSTILTGGLVGGGTARIGVTYKNVNASGGVGGNGLALFTSVETVSGGISAAGSTGTPYTIFFPHGTGGSVGAGSAKQNFYDDVDGTGGIVSAGSARVVANYAITTSGGSVVAGAAPFGKLYVIGTSGGALAASSAIVIGKYKITPQGGGVVSGFNINRHNLVGSVSGGGRLAGSALINARYRVTATGGSVGGGTARILIEFVTRGGIVCGGTVPTQVELLIIPAGVKAGGSFVLAVRYNINGLSGVACDGKARIARLRALTPVKTGVARTLAGDNILKDQFPAPKLLQPFGTAIPAIPNGVRTQDQADWNEITESSEGVLLPITIKRQRPYLPPKRRGTVVQNTQFATLTTA